MNVTIDERGGSTLPKVGSIIEFEFEGKSVIGIFVGTQISGEKVVILKHDFIEPGALVTYTSVPSYKLFNGSVTISND